MKLMILLIAVVFLTTCSAFAEDVFLDCGTMDYLEKQKKENPHLEAQMQAFEEQLQLWIKEQAKKGKLNQIQAGEVITVPVVVHILYFNDADDVSDKVARQIEILNRDYAGLNLHSMGAFPSYLQANTGIQFVLAKKKPDGSATNGIETKKVTTPFFTSYNYMKYAIYGGLDAWDPTTYFNIWVCKLTNYSGYAQFPGSGINGTYGVVVTFRAFGEHLAPNDYSYFRNGGVTTHEIGHCFDLRHIWGDDQGLCTGDDLADDVPNQGFPSYRYWQGPVTDDCSPNNPGTMYMNFMDYTNDSSWANFTPDQTTRIQACFASGGPLYSMLSSTAASAPSGCDVPTSIKAAYLAKTTVTLEWTKMYNANSYNVQYRKSGISAWSTKSTGTNSVQLTGLVKNTNYEYQVQTAASNCTSAFSVIKTFKTPNTENSSSIGTPTLIFPANNATGIDLNLTFTWNAVSNANYYIQVSRSSDFSEFMQTATTITSRIFMGLDYGTTYYWRVKGFNYSYSGAWSEVRSFTTIAPALPSPVLIYPIDETIFHTVNPNLSWNEIVGASGYEIHLSTDNFLNVTIYNTNQTSYQLTGLPEGTMHYWRVRAIGNGGVSEWSPAYFTTEINLPTGPVPILPINDAANISTSATFTWSSSQNADVYRLMYSEDPTFSEVSGGVVTKNTSTIVPGLKANTKYYWRVICWFDATYKNYPCQWSEVFSFTTGGANLVPPALMTPVNTALNVPLNTSLTWSGVPGASDYNVQYSTNSNLDGITPINTQSTSLSLSGLAVGTTYYWRVQSKNGELTSAWSNIWSFTTTSQGLEAPVLWSPVNNSQNVTRSPALYWYPVSGAAYYTLHYSTSSTFNTYTEFTNIETSTLTLSNLAAKTTYYWRVKAFNPPMESTWSTVWKFKTSSNGKFSIPEESGIVVTAASLSFAPNPFSNIAHFKLEVFEDANVKIEISDILGKNVATLTSGNYKTGSYEFDFNASNLLTGVYYCHLIVGDEVRTMQMVILK